jgi:hypothetical protein
MTVFEERLPVCRVLSRFAKRTANHSKLEKGLQDLQETVIQKRIHSVGLDGPDDRGSIIHEAFDIGCGSD